MIARSHKVKVNLMENFGQRRSNRRRGNSFMKKPIQEGEVYDVEIIGAGSQGDGIAKIEDFVIFVPGAKQGEKVKVKITQVRATSAVGEVVTGDEPADAPAEEAPEEQPEEAQEEDEEEEPEEPAEEPEEEPAAEEPEEEPAAEEPEEEKPKEE
jgi:predicted RNA-binding protein with TRAM domain